MQYILWIYIVFVLIFDRLTKIWSAMLPAEGYDLVGSFIRLNYTHNSGIAFGIPFTGTMQLAVTLLLCAFVIYLLVRTYRASGGKSAETWAYASILAWAVWNAYDRFQYGYVADFLSIEYFAICNLADIVISVWVLLLIASHLYHGKRK